MKYTLKTFGITREILGSKEIIFEMEGTKVAELRQALTKRYPEMGDLKSLLIAVNSTYAPDEMALGETDEIALIPPVSGG